MQGEALPYDLGHWIFSDISCFVSELYDFSTARVRKGNGCELESATKSHPLLLFMAIFYVEELGPTQTKEPTIQIKDESRKFAMTSGIEAVAKDSKLFPPELRHFSNAG